ncbi:MAG: N-6 DNA methylase [Bacteroidales bacterium]|nr:N-6 DNA methylase [Bacteroidales bacterium]
MSYSLKSIKEEFKAKGIFYTTNELALLIKSFVDIETDEVYDPTCGDGALLSVFNDDVKKYGQELNDHQLEAAKNRLVNFEGYCGDTLKEPAFFDRKFKCIVANPPFSIAWEPPILNGIFTDDRFRLAPALPPKSKADYAFILHILHYLADDGIAVVLNFPGILYRGYSEGQIRKWIVDNNWIEKIIRIPGKQFVDTTIETALIVFKKNKTTTDIEFIDIEKDKKYIATLEEIKKNNYTLSVSNFVQDDVVVVKYDPIELQNNTRKLMIENLKRGILFDKAVCDLEGFEQETFLDELVETIKTFYK